jgi:ectoine hydroxylase-related dioxygenase (phytanoyl-CoA dioxygenase family)
MRVLPGTHRETLKGMVRSEGEDNALGSHMDAPVDESRAVDVEVPRGGVSVHHPNLIHGSNPNRSGRRRCGLTIRYIPTSTRITREWKPFLLRGEDREQRNTYVPFPAYREGEHFPFEPFRSTARR